MKLSVLSTSKSKKEDIILSDAFVRDYNESLVHQAVVTYLAGMRQGSHKQKNRSEVRGGGKKPYRQKGTGRARRGANSVVQFRGGGVVHGPVPRSHSHKLPKKIRLRERASTNMLRLLDLVVTLKVHLMQ